MTCVVHFLFNPTKNDLAVTIHYNYQMEFLDECFCDGQFEELIRFLKMMSSFTFIVTSTSQGVTTSLTDNTLKELSCTIQNNCVVCPVHNCNIDISNLLEDVYNYKNTSVWRSYKK